MGLTLRLWASAFIIGLSSLLFGYCIACLNTVIAPGDKASPEACENGTDLTCPKGSILNDLLLDTVQQQLATAMTIIGAMLGGLFAAYPNDLLGRRKSLLLNNVFFIAGGILCGLMNVGSLMAGRFLVGLGTGVESMIAPVLLSEIAASDSRGAITSLHQLNITLGILISNLIGYFCVQHVPSGWRYVQFAIIVPAVLQLLLAWLVPESPRWLLRQGQRKEAAAVLTALRATDGSYDVEVELSEIDRELGESLNQPQASWAETFSYDKAMKIGMLMMMFSALTGINTIIFYSTTIFASAGVNDSLLGTVLVGVLNVVITMVSGYLVDHLGRKILLTTGTWLMLLALTVLGITLLAAGTSGGLLISVISVGMVLLYVMGFAIGLGAVQWVVVGEVVPVKIRSKAYSLFVTSNWTANLIVSLTTLTLIDTLGGAATATDKAAAKQKGVAILYLIFAAICVLCLAFLYGMVPETKGTVATESNAKSPRGAGAGWKRQESGAQTLIEPTADDATKV